MERFSLYIDHQQISPLIRELETIVQTCYQQLDEEYETYELRTSIYEEFVFHITSLYNVRYALKEEHDELKDEELKKYYEMTAKLEGIGAKVEYQEILQGIKKIKGRPSKYQEVQENFIEWIKGKVSSEGKIKFSKKELDQVYVSLLKDQKPKTLPTTYYLRIFKKYDLMNIAVTNRNGHERTAKEFFNKKGQSESFCQKQQFEAFIVKDEYEMDESDLNSTSELEDEELQMQYECSKEDWQVTKSSRYNNENLLGSRRKTRSSNVTNQLKKEKKSEKRKEKSMKMGNFFDNDSDVGKIDHEWSNLSISNEFFEKVEPRLEIYDNSKSYE